MPSHSQKFYDTIACNTWGDGVPAAGSKYLGSRATWLRCTRCDGTEMRLKLLDELPNAGSYGFAFECEHVRTGDERPNDGATLGRIVYCAKIYKREPREVTNELKLKKSREARDAHYTYGLRSIELTFASPPYARGDDSVPNRSMRRATSGAASHARALVAAAGGTSSRHCGR